MAAKTTSALEEVVFGNTVDSLFRKGLGERLTPRCKERMREAGIDLDQELQAYYPREVYYACVRIAATEIFGDKDPESALYELGCAFMSGFEATLLGRALLSAVRMLGPWRMLKKMTQNFRSSNNYLMAESVKTGPGEVEITLNQVSGAPSYFEGVLAKSMKIAGAKAVEVERVEYDGTRCRFRVRWHGRT